MELILKPKEFDALRLALVEHVAVLRIARTALNIKSKRLTEDISDSETLLQYLKFVEQKSHVGEINETIDEYTRRTTADILQQEADASS